MITTSFAYGDSYGVKDHYNEDERDYVDIYAEDDCMDWQEAEDGWTSVTWDGHWPL